jgi:hypothetical protein
MADEASELGSENSGTGGFEFSFGATSGSDSGDNNGGSGSFDFGIDPAGSVGSAGGTGDGDDFTFDPERHVGPDKRNADGSYRRKRGRRAGSTNRQGPRKASSKTSVNVNAVETALVGIHMVLATALNTPEIALEKDESKPLATAVAEVAKHYDFPEVAEKTLAWVSLAMVAGPMYMAKAMLVRERTKANKARNVTDEAMGDSIVPFFKAPDRSA